MKKLILFAAAVSAFAQTEVTPDHKINFRISAPKASEVTLTVDWLDGPQKMSKDEKGVWSLTLGPLAPATYIYSFNVDGMAIPDPINPRIKLRARGSGSLIDVPPGDGSGSWEARDVPHGSVTIEWHKSPVLNGETRPIWVYTPPRYAAEPNRRYPVMYLLHGSNDTAAGWTTAGSVNFILDNLIADKKAAPMIIVMPFGHALPFGGGRGQGGPSNTVLYEQYLLKDAMPLIEKKYRIDANPDRRAVAGQSMGGEQAMAIGFAHPELFHAIGGFSPSMPRELAERWASALADAKGTNAKMKLVWIACGRHDPSHLSASRRMVESMEKAGVKNTYVETEGAHNYSLWQAHMVQFAPLLFH